MRWRYRETVLTLCTAAFFVTMFGRLAISPVVPAITDDFGVSKATIGLALTGMWFAYGLAQYPSGLLADRFGERAVILVAIGGTGVMGLLIAIAPIYPVFFVFTVLLGVVAGLHFSVSTSFVSRMYDDVGLPIGVHNLGGPAAGLIAPVLVAWVALRYDWRTAMVLTAALALPVFVLFVRRIRPREPRRPGSRLRDRIQVRPAIELLSRPEIAFTVCIAVIINFVWQGLASFLPTFFVEFHDFSPALASGFFSAYFALQGVIQVGIGDLSDRYDRDGVSIGCLAVYIVGLALLVVSSRIEMLAVAVLLTAFGTSVFTPVTARFMDILSDAERNAGFGLVQSVNVVLGSFGSVAVGLFAEFLGWSVAFGVLTALICVALGAFVVNSVVGLGY